MYLIKMSLKNDPEYFWYATTIDGRPLAFDNYGYALRRAHEMQIECRFLYSEDEELVYTVVEKEVYFED